MNFDSPNSPYANRGLNVPNKQALPGGVGDSPSLIRDVVTGLEEQVKRLHEVISNLDARLETVMQPVPPSPVSEVGQTCQQGGSHLHCRLLSLSEDLGSTIARINSLTRRVEI